MSCSQTCLKGAVVIGLTAAVASTVASLCANPLQEAPVTQRAEAPGKTPLISKPLTAGVCPGEGNCFDPNGNGTPGCNDLDCCEAVCALDPFCCDVEWDSTCADEALKLCGNPACPGEGSCFEDNGTPGCDDPVCCDTVCLFDPFCCDTQWDSICADEAADLCQGGSPPKNDLCENAIPVPVFSSVVGSTDDATIDDELPFCGTSVTAPGVWYSVIGTGNTITATTCSEFSNYDTKISVYCGSCDEAICVTANDNNCAAFSGLLSTVAWCSQEGVKYLTLVHGFGGATGGFELIVFDDGVSCDDPVDCLGTNCGEPDAGNCFDPEGNGTPFCNDLDCCEAVCALDPLCCDVEWDSLCAGEALDLCGNPVCPGEGSCFEANGTPGCDDPLCCNKVCLFDAFCCDSAWDSFCADEAADLCQGDPEGSLDQPPDQVNGLFSDVDCDICDSGTQILAENFNIDQDRSIGLVRIFGGYFPDDLGPVDAFTVNFHEDEAGLPGLIINSQTAPATQTLTGVELFGVPEYQVDIEIAELSLTSGTYWVSVFNNTSANTDSFFWETGDLDPVHGKPGGAFRLDLPGPGGWSFDPAQELAITLLPPDTTCPWDIAEDGIVGAFDLLMLLATWGPCKGCPADFDGDGNVGASDLLALLANWGPCP